MNTRQQHVLIPKSFKVVVTLVYLTLSSFILVFQLNVLFFSLDAAVSSFCDFLENLESKAEILSDERDETEWEPLSLADLRALVNEIMSIRAKGALHMIPVDDILRMLKILDHQIHRAEGLSIGEHESVSLDSDHPCYHAPIILFHEPVSV